MANCHHATLRPSGCRSASPLILPLLSPITGVPGVEEREMNFNAFDLSAAHIFKIRDGEIHEIEAMGFAAPYDTPDPWH